MIGLESREDLRQIILLLYKFVFFHLVIEVSIVLLISREIASHLLSYPLV